MLNCGEGEWSKQSVRGEAIAEILHVSIRKLDRAKKSFVEEELEAALGRRKSSRRYKCKADGDFDTRLVALSCSELPKGYVQWSLRLPADRAVELNYIDSISYETVRRILKKTKSNRGGKFGWVILPVANAEFVAAIHTNKTRTSSVKTLHIVSL